MKSLIIETACSSKANNVLCNCSLFVLFLPWQKIIRNVHLSNDKWFVENRSLLFTNQFREEKWKSESVTHSSKSNFPSKWIKKKFFFEKWKLLAWILSYHGGAQGRFCSEKNRTFFRQINYQVLTRDFVW